MTGPDRRRFPPCGRVFDGQECRKRGEHLCVPRADHAVSFFRELLVHTKGTYARQAFIPSDWQRRDVLVPLFGTVVWEPGWNMYLRRYRELYLSTGRKNGKTELIAGIMLYLLVGDGEESAEVYGLALDKDQVGTRIQRRRADGGAVPDPGPAAARAAWCPAGHRRAHRVVFRGRGRGRDGRAGTVTARRLH